MGWSRRKPDSKHASITASSEGTGTPGRLLPASRLEALSGGVFAIAITLLVLELHVPAGQQALVKSLGHEWPRYLGYFVSFTFIGGVWIAYGAPHRRDETQPRNRTGERRWPMAVAVLLTGMLSSSAPSPIPRKRRESPA